MKSLIMVPLLIWGICSVGIAQNGEEFDFWVGQWDLTWDLGEGKVGHGVNNIAKTLDGKVIQENFEATDAGQNTGFKGTSISVFNPNTKTWHQAWADNQGGYFNFTGDVDDNSRIFKTQSFPQGDKTVVLRMVFNDIQEDSFTWDWEKSENDGESWSLQWRIKYKRAD